MSMFRHEIRSSFVNGASFTTLCGANTISFRSSGTTWYPDAVLLKYRLSRSDETPDSEASL
jgi:hypothetical protein